MPNVRPALIPIVGPALIPIVGPTLIPIVGPEMMPNAKLSLLALMDLKYKVNTNTKQRRIKLNK